MRWVYILRCEEGYYYIGETSRLYRRFWEHENGLGGLNTSIYPPINIVAIYPVRRAPPQKQQRRQNIPPAVDQIPPRQKPPQKTMGRHNAKGAR